MRKRIKINEHIYTNCQGLNSYHTPVCNSCSFREPFKDNCKFFSVKLEKRNQRNGGFHHVRAKQCLNAEERYDHLFGEEDKQVLRYENWYSKHKELEIAFYRHSREEV